MPIHGIAMPFHISTVKVSVWVEGSVSVDGHNSSLGLFIYPCNFNVCACMSMLSLGISPYVLAKLEYTQ